MINSIIEETRLLIAKHQQAARNDPASANSHNMTVNALSQILTHLEEVNADLISTTEAGKILGTTYQHVSRYIHRGELQGERIGRTWYVSRRSVEALLPTVKERRERFGRKGLLGKQIHN